MLIELIKKHLDNLDDRKSGNALRASSAGKCARAIAYQQHGFQGEKLNWRARLVFKLGDHVESDLVTIAKDYGLTDTQREVSLNIAGVDVKGHIDGIYNESVVDFKSTTTYGIKKAQEGDVGSYDRQMHFYMKALGLKRALLVYYCKETSDLAEVVIPWNDKTWNEVEMRFRSVILSTRDNLPDREYVPDEKGKLPWQCSYCSYVKTCYPDYELTFDGRGKPVLKVRK